MREVHSNLFVGNEADCHELLRSGETWRFVHACKEPFHRQLLGYSGRGAPKEHPEYFWAQRGARLYLNLVDAPNPDYIPKQIIDMALEFIHEALAADQRVLVHCNQGESRGPSIALLYLAANTLTLPKDSLETAEGAFRLLYPNYSPASGMRGFLLRHWSDFVQTDEGL